jgi:transposase
LENEELRQENERLRGEIAQLKERIRELESLLEAALRGGKRQSAPFSKGTPKANPKPAGRKQGTEHGRHGHRQAPEQVDETVSVPAPCDCPKCGGELQEAGVEEQFQEEIPIPQPVRRRFVIEVARCRRCGRKVRGRHRLQTSEATGAAGAQVGAQAQAAAAHLHYELGLSLGKTARVLRDLCGINLTRGAVAQILARLGRRCEPTYQALKKAV